MDSICITDIKGAKYPTKANRFRPEKAYPEYCFSEISNGENKIYAGIRDTFHMLGLDAENYETKEWNPLKNYISPGMNVLVKPNMVMHYNKNVTGGTDCLYTNPSIVAAVCDYIIIALKGRGHIIIGDAPMQECDFDVLIEDSGYQKLIEYYREKGVDIELVDFRELKSKVVSGVLHSQVEKTRRGKVIDLGTNSEFNTCSENELKRIRITDYDPGELVKHHNLTRHEYYISQYILDADVIINIPKPKTHRKAGMTGALKNFVGANVRKEYLPHHVQGSIMEHGDEYKERSKIHSLRSYFLDKRNQSSAAGQYRKAQFYKLLAKMVYVCIPYQYDEGSWYGNNTISRTIADINKIIYHADRTGKMHKEEVRKVLIIGDMVVSGEKEGPVYPSPKDVGLIVMGDNPILFDEVVAALMGFDSLRIPTIITCKNVKSDYRILYTDHYCIVSNLQEMNGCSIDNLTNYHFTPTEGWKGHVER